MPVAEVLSPDADFWQNHVPHALSTCHSHDMSGGMVLESSALVSMLGVMAVGMVLESSALVSMLGVMTLGMALELSAIVSMLRVMAVGMVWESSASRLV